MLGNFLAKTLAGSAVGYITNYLAIKMLFSEYFKTPIGKDKKTGKKKYWSLGGVVVKERQEFESQISRLVESEVIHHKALAEQLKEEEVKKTFDKILQSFFQEDLTKSTNSTNRIAYIPEIDNSFDTIKESLQKNLNQLLENFIQHFQENFEPKDIISEAQIKHILTNLWEVYENFIEKNPSTQVFLAKLIKELSQNNIQYFIKGETSQIIIDNLKNLLKDLHNSLRFTQASTIEALLENIWLCFGVEAFVKNQIKELLSKSVTDILGKDITQELLQNLKKQIAELLQGEIGEEILRIVLKKLLEILKNQSITLMELLPNNLQSNFEKFLVQELPALIEKLVIWVQSKKYDLDNLIENRFRNNTSALGRVLIDIFVGSIAQYIGVEKRIVKLINDKKPDEIAQQASQELKKFLEKNTIGEIIGKLNEQYVFEEILPFLQSNIEKEWEKISLKPLQNWLEKPINTWLSTERVGDIAVKNLYQWFTIELKENWIYSEKLSNALQKLIAQEYEKLLNTYVSKWIKIEENKQYIDDLRKFILTNLQDNKKSIIDFLYKKFEEILLDKDEFNINSSFKKYASDNINEWFDSFTSREYRKIRVSQIKKSLENLQHSSIDKNLSHYIQQALDKNLEEWMKGRVEGTVKSSLNNLKDNQLRAMIYKALGNELRPLSIFGAILGTGTGAILSFLAPASANLSTWAIPALAYGATGWGTNWLAIRMLFKPYNPVKIPKINIVLPFTPGVVAKNQERFSNSMGRFIGDRLLDRDRLQNTFQENEGRLKTSIQDIVKDDDFALLQKLWEQNQEQIIENLLNWLWDFWQKPSLEQRSKEIVDWLKTYENQDLNNLSTQKLANQIIEFTENESFWKNLQKAIDEGLHKVLEKNQRVDELIPEKWQNFIQEKVYDFAIIEIQKLPQRLDKENFLQWLPAEKIREFLEKQLSKNLNQLLKNEQKKKFQEDLSNFLKNKLQSEEVLELIFERIDRNLGTELDATKKINQVFGGKLIDLLEKNLSNILKHILNRGIALMQSNRENIVEKVYQEADKASSFAFAYSGAIEKTTRDLIDEEIPNFFEKEFETLTNILHEELNRLGEVSLEKINLLHLNQSKLKNNLSNILNNDILLRKIEEITNLILEEKIFKTNLSKLLGIEISALERKVQELIKSILPNLQIYLSEKLESKEKIEECLPNLKELLEVIIKQRIFAVRLQTFTGEIIDNFTQNISENIINFFKNSETIKTEKSAFIQNILIEIKNIPIKEWLNFEELEQNLLKLLEKLKKDSIHQSFFKNTLGDYLEKSLKDLPKNISSNTKEHILKVSLEALSSSISKNIHQLINALEFKKIVVREIRDMNPIELEKLFYGFAGKYFKYLIGYGFGFGVLFGLLIDIAVFLLLQLF